MRLDPNDTQVAMEYAFLCYEAKEVAQARRIFDRVRKTGNATAGQAFQNIDGPLAAGIARWQQAIELGANDFSAHYELASLAEQRDDLALAADHYERAWRILPDRRSVLVDLGRVWKALNGKRRCDSGAAGGIAGRGGAGHPAGLMKLVALGVSAKVVVIVENQDASAVAGVFLKEMCSRQTTDASANDYEVVLFLRLGRSTHLVPKPAVSHLVCNFKGTFVASPHAREDWRIVIRRCFRHVFGLEACQPPGGECRSRSQRHSIEEVAAPDGTVHSQVSIGRVLHGGP